MMKRYEHGGGIYGRNIRLDFSVNTNPLGMEERVKNAAIGSGDNFGVYPDADYIRLREAIAAREGVRAENIVCSNGASEMIFAAVRAVNPQKALLVSPTFSEYERALLSVGCEIEYYETSEKNNFKIGGDFIKRLDGKDMTFICNPNNPTGTHCDKSILEAIAEEKAICIVDECFMDFADGYSMKGSLPVIKAFTKTYAMAGLRLGYLIAETDFAEKVKNHLPAWNVSAPAEAAGIAALGCNDYLEKSIKVIREERKYLTDELTRLGFKVFKSDTNFILIKGADGIGEALLKRGILIRECENFRGLNNTFYRFAVKTRAENEILIKELGDICG